MLECTHEGCKEAFPRQNALVRHIKSVHTEEKLPCPYEECKAKEKTFSRSDTLKRHINTVHKKQIEKCDQCEYECKRKEQLKKHCKDIHIDRIYQCKECGENHLSHNELLKHKKEEHANSKATVCQECQQSFTTVSSKNQHYHIEHEGFRYECKECEEMFKSKGGLKNHEEREHREEGAEMYQCHYCKKNGKNKEFPTEKQRNIHERIYHLDKENFHCEEKVENGEECDFSCCFPCELKQHIERVHLKLRKYYCNECKASFIKADHLKVHKERKHLNIKEKCDQCNEEMHPLDLKQHKLRIHENRRDYVCDNLINSEDSEKCKLTFFSLKELKIHQRRRHEHTKTIKCPHCNNMFHRQFILDIHIINFHQRKVSACKECDQQFSNDSNLYIHQKYKHSLHTLKKEEEKIDILLKECDIDFIREYSILFYKIKDTNKRGARIDFMIEKEDGLIFLEIDENQHKFSIEGEYAPICDISRMELVRHSLLLEEETRPIVWIRYNPNNFRLNGVLQKRVSYEQREKRLTELINNIYFTQSLELIYMYYDCLDNELLLHTSPDYEQQYKEICRPPIID